MKHWTVAGLGLALLTFLTGCTAASPDADTYDNQVALTLTSAVSEVRTVQRVLALLDDDRMLRPAAVAQLHYSEDGLDSAAQALTQLTQPPSRDRLATRVDTLLGQAGDLLAQARVVIERGHRGQYASFADELSELARTLEHLEKRVR